MSVVNRLGLGFLDPSKSVASSKRSGKSKADRKIEKEIEKMKENYGSIKSEIGTDSTFFQNRTYECLHNYIARSAEIILTYM